MVTCYIGKMVATCLSVNERSFDVIHLIKNDIHASN